MRHQCASQTSLRDCTDLIVAEVFPPHDVYVVCYELRAAMGGGEDDQC